MTWTLFETKIGTCGLAWSENGITAVQLPEESRDATEKRLTTKLKAGERATKKTTPDFATTAIALLRDHLSGKPQSFDDLPIDLSSVTEFNQSIYAALRKIPSGKTITYGDLAKAAGSNVGASRAVGRAMGMNPAPVIVPCHRVTAAGGKPGGFSAYGGIVTKDKLLTLEGTSLAFPLRKRR
jgi:methylated-DNA-[protein]-cysteine S-methyltransferase